MTLILDTRHIPLTERVDVVRETIARAVVHVDIDFPAERGPAAVYGAITDLGPVRVCSVRSNAPGWNAPRHSPATPYRRASSSACRSPGPV